MASGGGLDLRDAIATLDRTIMSSNSISGAVPFGGAIHMSSSNATDETVLITHGTVASNSASASHSLSQGGAIRQSGDILTIRNTAISDNSADDGGALFLESGSATVSLSTFSDNHARHNGGAIALDSGLLARTVELSNVTISGNSADLSGGGAYIKGTPLSPNAATLKLANSIVTDGTNGGIYLAEGLTQPVLDAGNSIVGAQASGADCTVSGAVILTTNGGNLESGTDCGFTHTADRQSVADLGLATLGSNGGETLTARAAGWFAGDRRRPPAASATATPTRRTRTAMPASMTATATASSPATADRWNTRACWPTPASSRNWTAPATGRWWRAAAAMAASATRRRRTASSR